LYKLSKKKLDHIGILGGTFDPPHAGHLHISKVVLKKLKLKKLLWVVAKKNPLKKKAHLSIKKRIKLSKKIIAKEKKIFVLYLDDKIKSSNTYNLLNYLKKKNENTKLYFLIGADNLVKFHKWKNWKKIPKLTKIVIFPRGNYLIRKNKYVVLKTLKKSDLIYINSKKVNMSSSLIRKFW
tara:strand:- start:268 stop:807 length:540 start_codon:yes stop_codon:yes gene_type:complete